MNGTPVLNSDVLSNKAKNHQKRSSRSRSRSKSKEMEQVPKIKTHRETKGIAVPQKIIYLLKVKLRKEKDFLKAGLDVKDEKIIQIAFLECIDGNLTNNKFIRLVNPEKELTDEVKKLTGIKDEDLVNMPKFSEIIVDLKNYLLPNGKVPKGIFCHNKKFDRNIILNELKLLVNENVLKKIEELNGIKFESKFSEIIEDLKNYLLSKGSEGSLLKENLKECTVISIAELLRLFKADSIFKDTMTWARSLFPEWWNHKLDNLNEKLGIDIERKEHSAESDAEICYRFFEMVYSKDKIIEKFTFKTENYVDLRGLAYLCLKNSEYLRKSKEFSKALIDIQISECNDLKSKIYTGKYLEDEKFKENGNKLINAIEEEIEILNNISKGCPYSNEDLDINYWEFNDKTLISFLKVNGELFSNGVKKLLIDHVKDVLKNGRLPSCPDCLSGQLKRIPTTLNNKPHFEIQCISEMCKNVNKVTKDKDIIKPLPPVGILYGEKYRDKLLFL